jgi:hypothetical protein
VSLSFGIDSVADYYRELLVPSFDEFCAEPLSARRAISCAIFTWHLGDWVVQQHQSQFNGLGITHIKGPLPALRAHLYGQYDGFEIIDGISNGSKHYTLTRQNSPAVSGSGVSHGFLRGPLLAFGTDSHLTVTFNGKGCIFKIVLKECIEQWQAFLTTKLQIQLS